MEMNELIEKIEELEYTHEEEIKDMLKDIVEEALGDIHIVGKYRAATLYEPEENLEYEVDYDIYLYNMSLFISDILDVDENEVALVLNKIYWVMDEYDFKELVIQEYLDRDN